MCTCVDIADNNNNNNIFTPQPVKPVECRSTMEDEKAYLNLHEIKMFKAIQIGTLV